ncbi:DUF2933 domain-containing protein [Ralstonia holmesii]
MVAAVSLPPFLPLLLFALCPLWHLVMHQGHEHQHEEVESQNGARPQGA